MVLISPTELARRCNISKQAAFDAIAKGVIPFTLQGKKKLIDLDDPAIQLYITDNNRQREAVKKNDSTPLQELQSMIISEDREAIGKVAKKLPNLIPVLLESAKKIRSEKLEQNSEEVDSTSKQGKGNHNKNNKRSEKQNKKQEDNGNPSDIENFNPYIWNARKKIAETKIKEFQADAQNKDLAPMEVIDSIHFRYLERFNSNMERLASVYIGEVGKEILEAGEILPAHIEKFLSHILNAIHDNKLAVAKEFKKYDPKL